MVDSTKVKLLAVVFDRENEIYKPGELLNGKVLVEFTQPKKIRGLRIEVFGKSVVAWPISVPNSNNDGESRKVMISSQEEYLSLAFYILGSETGRAIELPAGQLVYPFSVQLPIDLPSSIEHTYGNIRYQLKAIFERPWKFNYEIKTGFTITSNYNLNQKPQAALPMEEDIQKRLCCLCIWPLGKVNMTISVPVSGFVPGQAVPVTIRCQNESTVSVLRIKVFLQRKLKFYASTPQRGVKEEEVVVAEKKCENPFTAGFEDDVIVQLIVPQLPPSGLEFCSIIDLSYTLRVVICFSGMHFSTERIFPILIGTVPLHLSVGMEQQNSAVVAAALATSPLIPSAPPPAGTTLAQVIPHPYAMPQPQQISNAPQYPISCDPNNALPPPYDAGSAYNPGYTVHNYPPANSGGVFNPPKYDKR